MTAAGGITAARATVSGISEARDGAVDGGAAITGTTVAAIIVQAVNTAAFFLNFIGNYLFLSGSLAFFGAQLPFL
jgi:hypothetical protein